MGAWASVAKFRDAVGVPVVCVSFEYDTGRFIVTTRDAGCASREDESIVATTTDRAEAIAAARGEWFLLVP